MTDTILPLHHVWTLSPGRTPVNPQLPSAASNNDSGTRDRITRDRPALASPLLATGTGEHESRQRPGDTRGTVQEPTPDRS